MLWVVQVTIQIEGKKGVMNPRPLKKNIGVNFVFRQGTTETFYIKGPDIGDLKLLAIEVRAAITHVTRQTHATCYVLCELQSCSLGNNGLV